MQLNTDESVERLIRRIGKMEVKENKIYYASEVAKAFKEENMLNAEGVSAVAKYIGLSGYMSPVANHVIWWYDHGYIMQSVMVIGVWARDYVYYRDNWGEIRKRIEKAHEYLFKGEDAPQLVFRRAKRSTCKGTDKISIGIYGVVNGAVSGVYKDYRRVVSRLFRPERIIFGDHIRIDRGQEYLAGIFTYAHEVAHCVALPYRDSGGRWVIHGHNFIRAYGKTLSTLADLYPEIKDYVRHI